MPFIRTTDECAKSSDSDSGQLAPPKRVATLSKRYRRWICAGLIACLPAILFIPLWRAGGVSAIGDDIIYYLPVRAYIGQQLRSGHLPVWNPLVAMGAPLAADPQAGLWYPFTWLFALMSPVWAYCLNVWSHYVLAGWGMYRFLRALGREWAAALLGALAFEFCPYMIAHREHLTILEAVAWIPWILFAWQRYAFESRKPRPGSQAAVESQNAGEAVRRHASLFAWLGCAFWGMQLLVQHIQPAIMTAVLLLAYAVFILRPVCPRILLPLLGSILGAGLLASVQFLPTFHLFSESGRASAPYHLFIENSWLPSSALMLLFPMFYGNPGQQFWTEKWWGLSHMCEQWAYPTIIVLMLALASLELARSPQKLMKKNSAEGSERMQILHSREIWFWWGAGFLALLVALGGFLPLSKALFHIPIYRNLRVPARWILIWSVGMPVLASATMHQLIQNTVSKDGIHRALRLTVTRLMPFIVLSAVLFMVGGGFLGWFLDKYGRASELAGMLHLTLQGVCTLKPAILWPLFIVGCTGASLLWWARSPVGIRTCALFCVFLLDVAAVAPFANADLHTYAAANLAEGPPLLQEIRKLQPQEGERLLVPRTTADYERPLDVLWPETNMLFALPTLNSYGPFGGAHQRWLLRFMPWGASEDILSLLTNVSLLQRVGVRFIAGRSTEEKENLSDVLNLVPDDSVSVEIKDSFPMRPVPSTEGILWGIQVDEKGLYRLEFDATPLEPAIRWFVSLETVDHGKLATTHSVEPVDLAPGSRRLSFVFACGKAPGVAFVRIKSEQGIAVSAGRATIKRLGTFQEPLKQGSASSPSSSAPTTSPGPVMREVGLKYRTRTSSGVDLYEIEGAQPLFWVPQEVHFARHNSEAIDWLTTSVGMRAGSASAVIESVETQHKSGSRYSLHFKSLSPEQISAQISTDTEQLLIFNESYSRGWTAAVDGQVVEIHRVNAIVQGIWCPPGNHEVQFRYQQPGLKLGLALSGVMAVILGLGIVRTSVLPETKGRG